MLYRPAMLDSKTTVANAVLEHSECAPVFQRHRIDYCCKGGRTIAEACRDRGLEPDALMAELRRAIEERRGAAAPDPTAMSTPELIGYIVSTHHVYLRKTLPFLQTISNKVRRVHGDRDPRLVDLDETVREIVEALDPHLDQEEEVLFPALIATARDPILIKRELETMHDDHLAVGKLLDRVRDLTGDFTLPDWACTSYRTLFAQLEQCEGDILRHVHLENHVLMPRFA